MYKSDPTSSNCDPVHTNNAVNGGLSRNRVLCVVISVLFIMNRVYLHM